MTQSEYRELLLGCGHQRLKHIGVAGKEAWEWKDLTTLDINPEVHPDTVWDMNRVPLPFDADTFDEIHAYEVLEHCGRQGDWRFFFDQFSDFWRILKPGGLFFATVPGPDSCVVWGDPGHTRTIQKETVMYLDQNSYLVLPTNPITDYRWYYKRDFEILESAYVDGQFRFILRARKGADNG